MNVSSKSILEKCVVFFVLTYLSVTYCIKAFVLKYWHYPIDSKVAKNKEYFFGI
jgi:hypothetical protein